MPEINIESFGTTIPKGYLVKIVSWENDGDYYKTNVIGALTENGARYTVEFANKFKSRNARYNRGLGNGPVSAHEILGIMKELYAKYPKEVANDSVEYLELEIPFYLDKEKFDEWIDENVNDELDDTVKEYISGFIGSTVDECSDYVRVCESTTIYYLESDVVVPPLKEVLLCQLKN